MKYALLGNPNVGKSSLLNQITGSKVFVSNYPGTSIEVLSANLKIGNQRMELFDTPGVYSLHSDNQEAEVTRDFLKNNDVDMIINILDATNLERNLVLTFELLAMNYPLLIVINQIDRARAMGLSIDAAALANLTKAPVILFSANTGEGVMELLAALKKANNLKRVDHKENDDKSQEQIVSLRDFNCNAGCTGNCKACAIPIADFASDDDYARAASARQTARCISKINSPTKINWLTRVEQIIDRPIVGTIILLFLAYIAFLILVKFIALSEGPISALLEPFNLYLEALILRILPEGFLTTVFSQAIPEGLLIPFTIIMPAMLMVSFLMALLEDTGLLPRYSVALERAGSLFGVSGQAVIPLALGFGCRTPAVMATRILQGNTERFIVITLLSIVIPCAATIGIMASVVAGFNASIGVLLLSMLVTMIILGRILSRKKEEKAFIYELPPLRIPILSNVKSKIKIRFAGFFTEVLPLLLLMSIVIRALMHSGVFNYFHSMEALTRSLFGVPAEAFIAVLITIFQRYLAPLVLLNLSLTPREATIAITMISLSLPCLPVMVMTVREIGFKKLFIILGMGLTTSMTVGIVLNLILPV